MTMLDKENARQGKIISAVRRNPVAEVGGVEAGRLEIRPMNRKDAGGVEMSAAERVFRDVVSGLYEGRYVPGQRLVESDLSVTYQVGRGTVREALARLASENIVQLSPHRGAQIRRLTRSEAGDIVVLLENLMGLAARLAAQRIEEPDSRRRMEASLREVMRHRDSPGSAEFPRSRNDFMRALVEVAGNGELRRLLRSLNVHLLRVQMRQFPVEGSVERFEDYEAMGAAILNGNVKKAELAGRRYMRRVGAAIDKLPDRAFPRE